MEKDGLIVAILAIMFIAIVGMVVLFIAGDLHEQGRTNEVETFTVNDPGSNKECTLDHTPDNTPVVRYHNGTAWKTLTVTTHYTVSDNTITVLASAMD